MFSLEEKKKIAEVVERVLLEIDHPEMPKEKPDFKLHVKGKEDWSWADIDPNWYFLVSPPKTSDWNENARQLLRKVKRPNIIGVEKRYYPRPNTLNELPVTYVLVEGSVEDYVCYVALGEDEIFVAQQGNKISFAEAKCYFPWIEESKYRI